MSINISCQEQGKGTCLYSSAAMQWDSRMAKDTIAADPCRRLAADGESVSGQVNSTGGVVGEGVAPNSDG